ncbi:hypothetical protein MRX96_033580 [Rhipicephalus microplus]
MAAIFLVLFFVLSIYGIYISGQSREWYTCYTAQCSEAAAYLKARLLQTGGDACNNFYDFVCHSWSHHRAFAQSFIEDLKDSFWSGVNRTLLGTAKPPPPSPSGIHLMYAFYKSCYHFMTTRNPVPDRVRSVFEKTNAARWVTGASYAELVKQMIHLALNLGIITVFELKFTKVGDSDLLHISKGSSLRYKATPVTNERIYHDYIKEVLQVIGYKSHLEGSFSYVDTIDRSVEANFAKISRTKSANFTELGTLDSRASAQVWLERINRDVAQRHWQKEDSEILATGLEQIRTVMGIVMGGGLRNATAYITVQVVMEVLRYDFFRRYEQQHARDVVIMCLNTTRQFLFYTWPALVANLTLNSSDVEASRKLFDDILEGVVDHMNRVHWLELPSRLEATRKVRNVRLITINPNISDVSVSVSRQVNYSKLSRPPADFVNTYIEAAQLDTLLRREVGNEEYGLYGKLQLEGDVAYMKLWSLRSGAELFLPTLLSKPPLFYPEAGEPFNYGTLGVLVAMALSSATLLNYHEATRCYEEQYRRLSNSTASFPEEQRDQVFLWTRAARIAFDRYRLKYKARIARGRERLQHDRVFFMRLCLLTCASREEVGHLWPRFRCHMPLLNMREFSEAFSCRTIDLLAPEKKCPSL